MIDATALLGQGLDAVDRWLDDGPARGPAPDLRCLALAADVGWASPDREILGDLLQRLDRCRRRLRDEQALVGAEIDELSWKRTAAHRYAAGSGSPKADDLT